MIVAQSGETVCWRIAAVFAAVGCARPAGARGGKDGGGGRMSRLDAGGSRKTNGTFVGGERLKPGVKRLVTAGTQIALAEVKLIFDGEVPGTEATETYVRRQISDQFSPGPRRTRPRSWRWSPASRSGDDVPVRERNRHYVIGRDKGATFVSRRTRSSREHATFTWRDQGVEVADLGVGERRALVNGNSTQGPTRLYDGDLVQVGPSADAILQSRRENPLWRARCGRAGDGAPSQHAGVLEAEAQGVRATPRARARARRRRWSVEHVSLALHPAVGGAMSAARAQRRPSAPTACRWRTGRTRRGRGPRLPDRARRRAGILGVAALVGGLTAR